MAQYASYSGYTGGSGGGGGGGANIHLSNLASTAINADLNLDTDLAYSIGNGNRLLIVGANIGFITHLRDASNDDSINPYIRQLYFPGAAGGGVAMDYSGNNTLSLADSMFIIENTTAAFANLFTLSPDYTSSFWSVPNPAFIADSTQIGAPGSHAFVIGSSDINTGPVGTTSGDVSLQTGDNNNPGATAQTGNMWIVTGAQNDAAATSPSGNMSISTGNQLGASGTSGSITINSGFSENGQSGPILVNSGGGLGNTGLVNVASGNTSGTGTVSGQLQLVTGDNTGTGNTADVIVRSGAASSGNSGDIGLSTGTASGTRGNVTLQGTQIILNTPGPVVGLTIKNGTAVLPNYTVGTLPSASTSGIGATAFVTDASTTIILGLGLTVVGGGGNKVPVYSDGINWKIG